MLGKIAHQGVLKLLRRSISNLFDYSPEVKSALRDNKPIVALESTIVTHGMPYPSNYQTALSVESIIKDQVSLYKDYFLPLVYFL